jgi:ADP-ribosyl-[dinitrogen reductase] hydrolase
MRSPETSPGDEPPGLRDRAVASILGLAIGDAIGSRSPAGSDATSLARNLWLSLIAHRGELAPADVLQRHLEWLGSDPPVVDGLTRRVLDGWREGAADPARDYLERRGPEVSAGNGSVKYCAPLGVAYARKPELLGELAPTLSSLTHRDGRCLTACLAVTLTVAALVRGEAPAQAVAAGVEAVIELEGGEELEYLVGQAGWARPIDGPDRGFTLFCAGIALQVVADSSTFADGLWRVVSLGGDIDANSALAGALLGAAHGRAELPTDRLAELTPAAAISDEAALLATML